MYVCVYVRNERKDKERKAWKGNQAPKPYWIILDHYEV
jgi:hypothetical protein